MTKKRLSWWKIVLIVLLTIVVLIIAVVGGYVIYMQASYYRIADNLALNINNDQNEKIQSTQKYSIVTYNIGFGAYQQDYTFFMDTGEMLDGTKTQGEHAKGLSKEDVLKNTEGSIELMKSLDADFYFTQEVDIDSTRSYHINQSNMIVEAFPEYGNIFTNNFHSPFLFYPLTDPHGAVEAGTETLSRYYIESSIRRSLPISEGFLEKFFDLDRCLTVNYLPLEGQENYLVLINLHLSAYDEGGVYRAKQIAMLNEILKTERDNGNYVIAGGDFNHDIADSFTYFKTTQKVPSWLAFISDEDLTEGYHFADANNNAPTCRGADMIYIKDETYTCVVDGFIVSDNIEINLVENVDNQFLYSDHNPVYMEFTLQK